MRRRAPVKVFCRQTHAIWLMALIIVALTLAVGIHRRWEDYQATDTQTRKEFATQVRLADEHFSGLVRNINLALDQIIAERVSDGHCDQKLLEDLAALYPEFRSFTLMDAQGVNRCASQRTLVGLDRSAEDYVKLAKTIPRNGVLVVETPFVSKLSKTPILIFRKAKTDAAGRLLMIAQVSIDLRYFDSLLESMRKPGHAMFMIHESGLMVSRVPDPNKYRLTDVSKSPAAFNAHRSSGKRLSTHRIVTATDRLEKYVALSDIMPANISPPPAGQLVVGVSETVESVYADWRRYNWIALAKWLMLSAVVFVLAWLVSRRQVQLQQEIAQLSDALDEHAIVINFDKDGMITFANDRFCDISSYRREELIGRKHDIVNSGTHPAEFFHQMWQTISGGKTWHGLICNRAKGGRLYWVNSTIVPIFNHKGKLDRYISICTDVTTLIETEEKLQLAKEEADAANKAKSVFLSNMSHELRNPLNAILGFSQLLQYEKLSPVIEENVDHIHKAGKHLLTLINEVLDLAKVESGKVQFDMEIIDVDRLMNETIELVVPLATRHGIDLSHQPAGETLAVTADATRLSQVLLNLISNAIKYNKPQGRVRVYAENRDGNRIRINVADTGIGLTPEDQQKLFTPFTRLGQKNVEGTGIGLTISKQLVELMNGVLGIDSEAGAGSIFWIEFAAARS
jgi:PAS domain S-box-containing protein